jgi:hypothetical protein
MACVEYDSLQGQDIILGCDITTGGLKSVRIKQFETGTTYYNLSFNSNDKTSNYTETLTNNDNGTTTVEKTLTIFLTGFDGDRHDNINELCNPFRKLVVEVNFADGSQAIAGAEFGAVLTSVKFETGANATDTNGVTLTFTAQESKHNIA